MNKDLAAFYRVTGPQGASFEKVALDPAQRAGVLTQGSFLAANGKPRQSSPIARGVFVRERLLCAPPPSPPPKVPALAEPNGNVTSTRERLTRHRADPVCATCHSLFDPLGLAFEHYDSVGAWRTTDAGRPVDAAGEIKGTEDIDGIIDGAQELGRRLATSAQARDCVARHWFRFAYGRGEQKADQCTLESLGRVLGRSGNDMRELLVGLTQADPFLYRSVETVP